MVAPLVSVVMGSEFDRPLMRRCLEALEMFAIEYEVRVLSAHRMPEKTASFTKELQERGVKVVIAGAGGAAHLPGVIAAYTTLPVIGVPLPTSSLQGVDALYSIVQMPPGVPVGCMALGTWGAFNAGVFAARIIALFDQSLEKKLRDCREKISSVERGNEKNKDFSKGN